MLIFLSYGHSKKFCKKKIDIDYEIYNFAIIFVDFKSNKTLYILEIVIINVVKGYAIT